MSTDTGRAPLPSVPLEGHIPTWLADIYAITSDFETAALSLHRYLDSPRPSDRSDDPHTKEADLRDIDMGALWSAALVAYRRAFGIGRTVVVPDRSDETLSDSITGAMSDDQRQTHIRLLERADTLVAEPSDTRAPSTMYAMLTTTGGGRGITGIARMSVRYSGPCSHEAEAALETCLHGHAIAESELERLVVGSDSVLARSLDLDALYRRADSGTD